MLKESISGVRGIVGDGFAPELVVDYCKAFSVFLEDGPIVIARDSRPHGKVISELASAALRMAGRSIIDIGIQSTPTAEVVVERTDAAGGIIITASHNPIEWNALKFLKSDGMFLDAVDFQKLLTLKSQSFRWATHDEIGKYEFLENAQKYHIDSIIWLPWLDGDTIRKGNFKVVLDSNGGTGSIALLPLLEKLNCEVIQ
ncbi:MAG TPA: phosphoglucosamine mutase, partial [candidate division Zixibacteria bacterium]|nr:phosphoglucosamine mutase [candidate division Zixibacteria bacterium]